MNKMKFILICLLVGYVFFRIQGCDISIPTQPDSPAVVVVLPEVNEPKLHMKSVVEDIIPVVFEPVDAALIAEYFLTLSDIVESDETVIKTTGNLKDYISKSGSLTFTGTNMNDKYTVGDVSLGKFVSDGLIDVIGKQNVSITDEQRSDAADFFDAVAWGVVVPGEESNNE